MVEIKKRPSSIILIVLLVFALFSTLVIAGGLWLYTDQKRLTRKTWQDTLNSIAELKKNQLVDWRRDRLHNTLILSQCSRIEAYVRAADKNGALGQELKARLATVASLYDYDEVLFCNRKGEVIFSVTGKYLGALNENTLSLINQALTEKKILFGSFYLCQLHNTIHVDLVAPLVSRGGDQEEVLGGLVFIINPEKFLYPLIQSWPTPDNTAETLLVEQEDNAVVYLNKLRHVEAAPLTLRRPFTQEHLPAVRALQGWSGALTGLDYRGVPVLAVAKTIPDSSWRLIAKVDLAEIDQPLEHEAGLIIPGVVGLILAVGAVLGWTLSAQRKKHYKALYRLERERQAVSTHFEYLVRHANDIILLMDWEGNLKEVNDRAVHAYGYTKEELLGLNIRNLVPAEEATSLLQWSREELTEQGKIYEGRHQRRDGSVFPVEVSVNFFRVEGKDFFQEIVRDITERKQGEAALEMERRRLSALMDAIPGFVSLRAPDYTIPFANQYFQEYFGDPAGRLCYQVMQHRQQPCEPCPTFRVFATRAPQTYEWLSPDGLTFQIFDYPFAAPDGAPLVLELGIDMTERKKAEEALAKSEATLQNILRAVPVGIAMGKNRVIEWTNDYFTQITGYSREELQGRNTRILYESEVEYARVGQLLFNHETPRNQSVLNLETRFRRKDGKIVDVAISMAFFDPSRLGGYLGEYIVSISDITLRKTAAESLRKEKVLSDTIIDVLPGVFYLFDEQGRFRRWNQNLEQISGYASEDFAVLGPLDFFTGEDKIICDQAIQKGFREGEFTAEAELSSKDGRKAPYFFTGRRFEFDGSPCLLGVGIDMAAHKRVEEALRDSEERFRLAFDNANVGMTIVNLEGRHLQVNQALADMMGYKKEELSGMSVQDTAYPEDLDTSPDFIRKAVAGEVASGTFEKRHVHKNGRVLWTLVNSSLVRDAHGVPAYFISLVQDITSQRQAEAASALHTIRLQALLDLHQQSQSSREEILDFVQEAALKITQSQYGWVGLVDGTESAMTIHSWSKETMDQCGMADKPIHYPAAAAGIWGDIIRRRQVVLVNDYPAPHPDKKGLPPGHVPIQRFLAIPVLDGGTLVAGAAVANKGEDYLDDDIKAITSLIQQAWGILTRREAVESYRTLVNNAPLGIFLIQDGKFIMVNYGFEKISGYSEDEILDNDCLNHVVPEYRADVRRNAAKMLRGESHLPYEFPIITKSGETKWVVEQVAPMDYRGKIATLGYFLDISERRSLEAQFLQAQKMEAVGRLAGGVAHDFNNILNVILGYSELMKMTLHQQDPLTLNLEEIIKAGERAAKLTQQLLAFSRKQIIEPQVLNLNAKIIGLERMLHRLIGEDIDLIMDLDPSLAMVKADSGQIDQIIMNLAVNARDAMPEGGKLILETANVSVDQDYTRTHPYVIPGPYILLTVSDNGLGMDKATQSRIFEPFYTTKPDGKGTGLGLATVYGIVKQNNGYIQVYSEIGRGSAFKIYLPQIQEEVGETPERKVLGPQDLYGSETVLLVEDDDALRDLTRAILVKYRYQVLEARNGGEALLLCEQYPGSIQLILTDVIMPQMNGRELVDRLRLLRPDLKAIYMSGYTTNAVVHHGVIEAKMPFIQKPFAANALLEKIRQVLAASPSPSGVLHP